MANQTVEVRVKRRGYEIENGRFRIEADPDDVSTFRPHLEAAVRRDGRDPGSQIDEYVMEVYDTHGRSLITYTQVPGA